MIVQLKVFSLVCFVNFDIMVIIALLQHAGVGSNLPGPYTTAADHFGHTAATSIYQQPPAAAGVEGPPLNPNTPVINL